MEHVRPCYLLFSNFTHIFKTTNIGWNMKRTQYEKAGKVGKPSLAKRETANESQSNIWYSRNNTVLCTYLLVFSIAIDQLVHVVLDSRAASVAMLQRGT